jgi:hypothetical protein
VITLMRLFCLRQTVKHQTSRGNLQAAGDLNVACADRGDPVCHARGRRGRGTLALVRPGAHAWWSDGPDRPLPIDRVPSYGLSLPNLLSFKSGTSRKKN